MSARSPVVPMTVSPSARVGSSGNVCSARRGTRRPSRPTICSIGYPASTVWEIRFGASVYETRMTRSGAAAAISADSSGNDTRRAG